MLIIKNIYIAGSCAEFTGYYAMSDVCVHLIHWVLGRGNEHEFPRAGITLMTLRAALCAVTFDLCSSSLTKNTTREIHMHAHTRIHASTPTNTYMTYRAKEQDKKICSNCSSGTF